MFASDVKHSSPSLEEKLTRLYGMGRKTINQDFRPEFIDLLQALGDPHKKLPPVIHVAGTNGKGSIVAGLRSILEAEGYKVHAYTSPHLCSFNERIRLAGKNIGDDFLESLIDKAIAANNGNDITFFEITTAIAFTAFSQAPADMAILEVGLGGRMDCTNIIERPLVSIIGSIGYDHMEWLGDTLPKIAAEKAGIIKPGIPCVLSPQTHADEVTPVFEKIAAQRGSRLARAGSEWSASADGDVFKFVYGTVEMTLPRPSLCGIHQIGNAGAALAALEIIKDQLPVSGAAIEKGLRNISWPARLQNLTKHYELPGGWELWLDGGHNEDAARILAEQANEWATQDGKPLHLILGMMGHKDPAEFLKPLGPHLASLTLVDIPHEPKAWNSKKLMSIISPTLTFLPLGEEKGGRALPVHTDDNFQTAINYITQDKPQGRILIAGSLYLAGHVLKCCGIQP